MAGEYRRMRAPRPADGGNWHPDHPDLHVVDRCCHAAGFAPDRRFPRWHDEADVTLCKAVGLLGLAGSMSEVASQPWGDTAYEPADIAVRWQDGPGIMDA